MQTERSTPLLIQDQEPTAKLVLYPYKLMVKSLLAELLRTTTEQPGTA